ncbi:DUF418 domain-containing protein [Bacillus dakarensis]|uniref:DUF418 domain-containing protein n=1 Tax=Robertmurraya dakarensis TaxID=1926278 RepID=UPI001F16EB00|nr:DUF418 domain-containing protein [Bacillus dakarensis]
MNPFEENRIMSLDVMRGIAIFGIFLVNMLSFHSPFLYLDPFSWWQSPSDQFTYILIDIFAQGSFYPLFALLFGYGLIILRNRTIEKGLSFIPLALRRFSILLIIGIVHAIFIWHGDILVNYAVFGFIFLLFIKMSAKSMMVTGFILWLVPNLFLSFLLLASGGDIPIYNQMEARESVEIYQQGSFMEITEQRMADWYAVNNPANGIFMLFSIFSFFLIGGGAAKLRIVERIVELRKPLKLALIFFLTLGFSLKLLPYILDRNIALEYIQDAFGGPLLAIALWILISLILCRQEMAKRLAIFAPVGRMSISNYLIQSLLSTFLFYSYGAGLYDKISVIIGTILVILIYAGQILMSRYWLKGHRYGPVEWLWRSLTYKKLQPWKVKGRKF